MSEYFTRGEVALWLQPDGPNTVPVYLGCHQMDSVSEPLGENSIIRCPDPSRPNAYRTLGKIKAPPDLVSFAIQFRIQSALDYLETMACPGTVFALLRKCGRADLFTNYERAFAFLNADITARGNENLAALEANDATVMGSADFQADPPLLRYKGVGTILTDRQAVTEIRSALDMWFYDSAQCPGCCPQVGPGCERGFISTAAPAGSALGIAHVLYTVDGTTWTVTTSDPFGAGEDAGAVVAFYITATTVRIVVARTTTDAGNPAEIAYSDDNGVTWTNVNVGTTIGEYISSAHGLFALDSKHLWAATGIGSVFFSNDGGLTWALQFASGWAGGAAALHFYDASCGVVVGDDSGAVAAYTTNGGQSWADTADVPATDELEAVWLVDCCHWWTLSSSGELAYTADSGATWATRALPNQASIIASGTLMFVNPLTGWVTVGNNGSASYVFRTINGGYDWEPLTVPANSGLPALWACGLNEFYIAGDANAGTMFVAHGE